MADWCWVERRGARTNSRDHNSAPTTCAHQVWAHVVGAPLLSLQRGCVDPPPDFSAQSPRSDLCSNNAPSCSRVNPLRNNTTWWKSTFSYLQKSLTFLEIPLTPLAAATFSMPKVWSVAQVLTGFPSQKHSGKGSSPRSDLISSHCPGFPQESQKPPNASLWVSTSTWPLFHGSGWRLSRHRGNGDEHLNFSRQSEVSNRSCSALGFSVGMFTRLTALASSDAEKKSCHPFARRGYVLCLKVQNFISCTAWHPFWAAFGSEN